MKHKIKVQKGRWPSTNDLWYVFCLEPDCVGKVMTRVEGLFGRVTREEAHAIGVAHQTRHTNIPGQQCAACEAIGHKLSGSDRDERGRFTARTSHKPHECDSRCW